MNLCYTFIFNGLLIVLPLQCSEYQLLGHAAFSSLSLALHLSDYKADTAIGLCDSSMSSVLVHMEEQEL